MTDGPKTAVVLQMEYEAKLNQERSQRTAHETKDNLHSQS